MTPELQNLMGQAQQNMVAAPQHAQFLGYSTYLAIIICAIFSVLIFWKLCQIQKQLSVRPQQMTSSASSLSGLPSAESAAQIRSKLAPDDSRYMPNK